MSHAPAPPAPAQSARPIVWRVRGGAFDLTRRALVMGVLNVTPDSFYDGGRFHGDPEAALARALAMADEGADLVDVGGESTRPGSAPVPAAEEIARIRPVLERLVGRCPLPVSIDTRKTEVARVALDLGAAVLNDVSGLRPDPEGGDGGTRAELAARHGAGLVLMHMRGEPATMQADTIYADVVGEVQGFLFDAARRATEAGVPREAVALDPGVGFGKSAADSMALLRHVDRLAEAGYPVLVGVSRKSFFGKLFDLPVEERLEAGLAAAVACVLRGARLVRTHDVRATARALRVAEALL